jgi:hypothetical protein
VVIVGGHGKRTTTAIYSEVTNSQLIEVHARCIAPAESATAVPGSCQTQKNPHHFLHANDR